MIARRLSRPLLLAAALGLAGWAASWLSTEGNVGHLANRMASLADPPRDRIARGRGGRYRAEKDRERIGAMVASGAAAVSAAPEGW